MHDLLLSVLLFSDSIEGAVDQSTAACPHVMYIVVIAEQGSGHAEDFIFPPHSMQEVCSGI